MAYRRFLARMNRVEEVFGPELEDDSGDETEPWPLEVVHVEPVLDTDSETETDDGVEDLSPPQKRVRGG